MTLNLFEADEPAKLPNPFEDGKHMLTLSIDEGGVIYDLTCSAEADSPCRTIPFDEDKICFIVDEFRSVGADMLEPGGDGEPFEITKMPLLVGYRFTGDGEDYEGWVYPLRDGGTS